MAIIDDIRKGESDILEFKQELPQKDRQLLKTVVAFSNSSQGGRIIFGVDDSGLIIGVKPDTVSGLKDNLVNMISEACTPQIYIDLSLETIEDKTLLIATVPHGRATPYYIKKEGLEHGTYVRIGATTRQAEQEKLQELILEGNNKSYDSVVDRDAQPVSEEEVTAFAELVHSYLGDSHKPVTIDQLVGWKLLRRDGSQLMPSIAYRLLTHNDVYFARMQCGAFKGTTTDVFLDKKELSGSVCEQLEQAQSFILRHINLGAEVNTLHRTNHYEIPERAIREALVNAILHRNYLLHANIRVSVFDDRVEIFSPGSLYGITLHEMLNGRSSLRNPILADLFHKMNIAEKWGSGISRIKQSCAEVRIPTPSFELSPSGLTVVFHRNAKAKPSPGAKPTKPTRKSPSLTANHSAVLNYLRQHPNATYADLMSALQMNRSSVKYALSKLKSLELITRAGTDKIGHWIVSTKKPRSPR